ncbi:MAG TPA: hypothetical protein VKB58_11530 [Terriglobales bacterium]|jgi:hypothetical protein|nr:hypothetical protein [Terriglobales bacterium]
MADSPLTLCQITDTVYRADGSPAQGEIVIVWTAFTTAAGQPVAAGNLTVELGHNGQFTAALAPNAGAMPAGTFYRATYKLSDDSVQQAWQGEYKIISDFLPAGDVLPGNAVQVSAPSRGAAFTAIVREVELQVVSLAGDRSQYDIKFASDAAGPLALKFDAMTLPAPVNTPYDTGTPTSSPYIDPLSAARIYNVGTPSSSLYIAPLTAAQVTNVIATEITVDAGTAPAPGGGIEVRRSDGGWGPSDSGNLAGRFTTQTFTLPRLERVQGYYLRQYDGSSPAKYSRYSMLLHVDYPL